MSKPKHKSKEANSANSPCPVEASSTGDRPVEASSTGQQSETIYQPPTIGAPQKKSLQSTAISPQPIADSGRPIAVFPTADS